MTPPVVRGQETILDERCFGGVRHLFHRLDEIDLDYWENDDELPYWADVWPSGEVLATIIASSGALDGVRMLELGCGLGLPSIVASRLGAEVVASDHSSEALELLRANALLNGVDIGRVELDWQDPTFIGHRPLTTDKRTEPGLGDFDLVVASDVLYESWQPKALAFMLSRTVSLTGQAIVVDPDRLTARGFMDEATYQGFRVVRRAYPNDDESSKTTTSVYDLTWRR